jgi:hypothetical protein
MKPASRLIHPPRSEAQPTATVNPLIQKGSTVLLPDAKALYDDDAFVTYGRSGLASHEALKSALCDLERAEAVELYPSGVAAVAGALLAVLEAGDELLMTDTAYKPTRRFCDRTLARFGVATRYYDPTLSPAEVEALLGNGGVEGASAGLLDDDELEDWGLDELSPRARVSKVRGCRVLEGAGSLRAAEKMRHWSCLARLSLRHFSSKDSKHSHQVDGEADGSQPRRRTLMQELGISRDKGSRPRGVDEDLGITVAWGGSASTFATDLEEQERLLSKMFKPHKVAQFMEHQVGASIDQS